MEPMSGFKESDGTEEIMHQLELLEQEDIGLDKNQLKMSACQALSKLAAKNGGSSYSRHYSPCNDSSGIFKNVEVISIYRCIQVSRLLRKFKNFILILECQFE